MSTHKQRIFSVGNNCRPYFQLISVDFQFYADVLALNSCQIRCADGFNPLRCLVSYADGN
jgi:hypothetical protein